MRVDVTGDTRLTALVRALRFIDREWVKVWQLQGKQELEPEWKDLVARGSVTPLQRSVLARTANVQLNRRAILLRSGGTGRLKSGAPKSKIARAVEFGVQQNLRSRYIRKDKPTPAPAQHTVTRRTGHPFGAPVKGGRVVWPALGKFAPRAAAVATELFFDLMKRIPGVD